MPNMVPTAGLPRGAARLLGGRGSVQLRQDDPPGPLGPGHHLGQPLARFAAVDQGPQDLAAPVADPHVVVAVPSAPARRSGRSSRSSASAPAAAASASDPHRGPGGAACPPRIGQGRGRPGTAAPGSDAGRSGAVVPAALPGDGLGDAAGHHVDLAHLLVLLGVERLDATDKRCLRQERRAAPRAFHRPTCRSDPPPRVTCCGYSPVSVSQLRRHPGRRAASAPRRPICARGGIQRVHVPRIRPDVGGRDPGPASGQLVVRPHICSVVLVPAVSSFIRAAGDRLREAGRCRRRSAGRQGRRSAASGSKLKKGIVPKVQASSRPVNVR